MTTPTTSTSTSIVGVDKLYYAVVTETTTGGVTTSTYGAPKFLGHTQDLTVTPKVNTAFQYGDNAIIESANTLGQIDMKLTVTGMELADEAALLGAGYGNGALIKKSTDNAPWVAILYRRLKANGQYRYKVLYKGKFVLPDDTNKSKEDKVTFQGKVLSATFLQRPDDSVLEFQIDSELASTAGATAIGAWFTSVQVPSLT